MAFEPIKYKKYAGDPVGCFSAEMQGTRWGNTKFDHNLEMYLYQEEVGEFLRLIDHLFYGVCKDWKSFSKFVRKYGTEIQGEDCNMILAMNFEGKVLNYIMQIDGAKIRIFPYRLYHH